MKKMLLLPATFLALSCFLSCEKAPIPKDEIAVEQEAELTGNPTILEGNWEVRESYGGMMPSKPNYAPGNGNVLRFTKQKFERHFDGKLHDSGNFTIKDSVVRINKTASTHYVEYSNEHSEKYFFRMEGDKLIQFIGQIAADGVELTFVKL